MARKKNDRMRLDEKSWPLMKRLVSVYVRPHIWRIGAALLCMAVVAAATAAMAQMMKPLIDEVFTNRDAQTIYFIAAIVFAIFVAKGLAGFGEGVLMNYVGNRVVADLQSDLYHRLIQSDLAFFNTTSPGTLVSRFLNDVGLLRNAVSTTLTGFGRDLLTAVALIGLMFYQDWLLALISFFAFPTAVLPIVRIGKRMRKVSSNTQVQMGKLTTVLDETFQGIRHVKAYGMEPHETQRADATIDEVFRLTQKAAVIRNLLSPIMETLGGIAIVAVLLYGTSQVLDRGQTPGAFFSFVTALLLAYEPVKRLAKLNANLQEGLAAADRIFWVLDQRPHIVDKPGAKPLLIAGGEVKLEGVHFSYEGSGAALTDVSLRVPAGKTVALVGPSGAGKSTILNLLPRFYDVGDGRVTVDNQDVRDVTLASLRAAMALVSQEVILFDETVRANIAYGKPSASQAEIEEAARNANAHDFIAELPEGYDTPVGPRGAKLSGGQRQRIAIARAMLKNAPILLLDEATSALDSESERHVQRALKTLMRGRTTLVIAHRLSTVIDADLIYVLRDGQVAEQGTHAELLRRGGLYAHLYAQQFAEQEREARTAALRRQA
ncbi:MAG TPA: ABC transporter ATP-binding protein [Kiloniellales bacterium]|nr:ABC transporter ATP-binding protein [Kiloniellales bacterium]